LRAGKSKAINAAAILGLIVLTALMFDVLDTSNLLNPTAPRIANPPHVSPPPPTQGGPNDGTLVIFVTSNQNTTDRFAPPANASSGAEGVPVLVTFAEATIPVQAGYSWRTNAQGLTGCIECLPAGLYVVSIRYDGLNMSIPTNVFAGNQTLVQVSFTEKAYQLIYSENWGVLVTPGSAQYTMFAKVSSSAPVADVGQTVFLTMEESASPGLGYSVNATVVSEGAPTMGTQWLQLGTPAPVNLFYDDDNATSTSFLTVWTSSTTTTVGPITYSTGSLGEP
jgi:hypothetical protein